MRVDGPLPQVEPGPGHVELAHKRSDLIRAGDYLCGLRIIAVRIVRIEYTGLMGVRSRGGQQEGGQDRQGKVVR